MQHSRKTKLIVKAMIYWLYCGLINPVSASELNATPRDVQTYPRVHFLPFNPQNARDMIDRVPGFSFDSGTDLRGFGGTAGNVLIDGTRPTSKSGGLEAALTRISATTVVRIELIRGDTGTRETAGQSVVANIITQQIDTTTRWETKLERAAHGKINYGTKLLQERSVGDWNTSTQFNFSLKRRPLAGTRSKLDTNNTMTFEAFEDNPNETRQFDLSSVAKRPMMNGTLGLNGSLTNTPSNSHSDRTGFDSIVKSPFPSQQQIININRGRTNVEAGIDWTQNKGNNWHFNWLSLSSYEDFESQSFNALARPLGNSVSTSMFNNRQKAFESIFRTTLGRSLKHSLRPELSAEISYNRLNSLLSLVFEDSSGTTDIKLPGAKVVVEEFRGEIFANILWQHSNELTLEAGFGAEASSIAVSGDTESSQSFLFAKPFATLTYNLTPSAQVRLDARRTIGQLQFTDFVASASVADDRLLGGNPELGPDQTNRLSASVDLRSDSLGALNIEIFHEWRDDILEQIQLQSGTAGLGNAGSARVWGLRTTASLSLSSLVPGGLLELAGSLRDSTFKDPIIGATRSVSSIDSAGFLVEFRQDLIDYNMSWGVSYRPELAGPFYFIDEISTNRDGRYWGAFVEISRFTGLKLRLDLNGIGGQNFYRKRQFFDVDRASPTLGSQIISRDRGMYVALTLSGQR